MKIYTLACLGITLLVSSGFAQEPAANPGAGKAGRGGNGPRIVSPEVGKDRTVTFRLLAPKATEVVLTGEFMAADKPLTKDAAGLWSITVGPVEPETYHYHLTVDGVRTLDPGNPDLKTGSTPGTVMNIVEVRGDKPFFYDGQPVPHGDIRTLWYESKSLGTQRRVTVYLPPGYDQNTSKRYPVIYLFHGANADETAWTRFGRVNLILDNLLAAGKAKPFIVVMPFGYGVPPMAQGMQGQNTANFSKDLREDVIPMVDGRYRTMADRDHRGIFGLSMGGGESLSIGLNNLGLFSYVGGFSAAVGQATAFPTTYASLIADPAASNQKLHLLWIGCGSEDSLLPTDKGFSTFLTEHKIKHTFRESGGAHTWLVWRRYLNEVAPQLFLDGTATSRTEGP